MSTLFNMYDPYNTEKKTYSDKYYTINKIELYWKLVQNIRLDTLDKKSLLKIIMDMELEIEHITSIELVEASSDKSTDFKYCLLKFNPIEYCYIKVIDIFNYSQSSTKLSMDKNNSKESIQHVLF